MTTVLTVNAGSSSMKLRVLDPDDAVLGARDVGADDDVRATVEGLLGETGPVDATGHRVVHGGTSYVTPVVVDDKVRDELRSLSRMAPLHQPAALDAMAAVRAALPDLPAVACFDTAFHARLPDEAATYPVPQEWRDRFGVRRYGFHGLSHAYASRRAVEMDGRADARIVVAHLGSGASLSAVRGGRSLDTTMGFTPLDGIVMATRSGSVDPGLLLWLQREAGLSVDQVSDALEAHSGLLGLAGTKDMQEVLGRAADREPQAVLALGVYLHRLVAGVAAMAATLGGLDVLVFTGGVGERSAEVRARAVDRLAFLGVQIDPAANADPRGDTDVSAPGAPARTLVVGAREDVEIARGVREALGR